MFTKKSVLIACAVTAAVSLALTACAAVNPGAQSTAPNARVVSWAQVGCAANSAVEIKAAVKIPDGELTQIEARAWSSGAQAWFYTPLTTTDNGVQKILLQGRTSTPPQIRLGDLNGLMGTWETTKAGPTSVAKCD